MSEPWVSPSGRSADPPAPQQYPPQYPPPQYPPPPYPPQHPPQVPEPARPTSGWAIAALITGMLPLPPAALLTGTVALVRIRRRNESGAGLALGGLAGAFVWLCLGALAVIVVNLPDLTPEFGDVAGRASQVPASVGSCVLAPDDPDGDWLQTTCDGPFDGEVFVAEDLPGDGLSAQDVAGFLDALCYDRFEEYVGEEYWSSDEDYLVFPPTAADWAAGQRRGVCVLT